MIGGEYGYDYDGSLNEGSMAFSDKTIRMGFIRKVYGILMCQLSITLAFIAVFTFVDSVKEFSQRHTELFWIAFALTFVCLIAMACCPNVRRNSPTNFIFLGIFTLCESFMLGLVASLYETEAVMMAVGICAVVSLALTIFAFQTKIDFTVCSGFLFVTLIIFVLFGFICIFIPHSKILTLVYASLGALIFSLYLIFDTQMMIGGKHKYSISPEEYIFAALNLYLDIINLFMYILMIIGAARE